MKLGISKYSIAKTTKYFGGNIVFRLVIFIFIAVISLWFFLQIIIRIDTTNYFLNKWLSHHFLSELSIYQQHNNISQIPIFTPNSKKQVQYPFLCQTYESGLGQPLVDNFIGIGSPVFYTGGSGDIHFEKIIGYSKDCRVNSRKFYYELS